MNLVNLIGECVEIGHYEKGEYFEVTIRTSESRINDVTEEVERSHVDNPVRLTGRWLNLVSRLTIGTKIAIEGCMFIDEIGGYKVKANDVILL